MALFVTRSRSALMPGWTCRCQLAVTDISHSMHSCIYILRVTRRDIYPIITVFVAKMANLQLSIFKICEYMQPHSIQSIQVCPGSTGASPSTGTQRHIPCNKHRQISSCPILRSSGNSSCRGTCNTACINSPANHSIHGHSSRYHTASPPPVSATSGQLAVARLPKGTTYGVECASKAHTVGQRPVAQATARSSRL